MGKLDGWFAEKEIQNTSNDLVHVIEFAGKTTISNLRSILYQVECEMVKHPERRYKIIWESTT